MPFRPSLALLLMPYPHVSEVMSVPRFLFIVNRLLCIFVAFSGGDRVPFTSCPCLRLRVLAASATVRGSSLVEDLQDSGCSHSCPCSPPLVGELRQRACTSA